MSSITIELLGESAKSNRIMLKKFGRYELKTQIGEGGMGIVYLAYDPRFERDVALKVLPAHAGSDKKARARFIREVKTIASLEHAAIVPLYDYGEYEDQLFFVMRLMKGNTLLERLQAKSMTLSAASVVINRLSSALQMAHERGIVHRDLKPANILFDSENKAYLSDFGVARVVESTSDLTGNGYVGTWPYMSPEQFKTGAGVDHRSDIYAMGIILFEMLTGQRPFQADTPAEWVGAHLREPIPFIHEICGGLPPGCELIVAKAMAKKPEERFNSVKEMAEALEMLSDPQINEREQEELLTAPTVAGRSVTATGDAVEKRPFLKQSIPNWLSWAILIAAIAISIGLFVNRSLGVFTQTPTATATPAATAPPSSTTISTATVIATTSSSTLLTEPEAVIVALRYSDSAIWQTNDQLQRIPDTGLLPLSNVAQSMLIQSNAGSMELVLPDQTKLYLGNNTDVWIEQVKGVGAAATAVTIDEGLLLIATESEPVSVTSPSGLQAQLVAGVMGVRQDERQFDVDCLDGRCSLLRADETVVTLTPGQHISINEMGEPTDIDGANYSIYEDVMNRPSTTLTLTPMPTSNATSELIDITEQPDLSGAEEDTLNTHSEFILPTPVPLPTPATSSPSGFIVFTCYIDEVDDLCTIHANGGNEKRLTATSATDFYASITPDGQILFSSRRERAFFMHRMGADGSNQQQYGPTQLGAIYAPAMSPDGRQVAFTVAANGTQNIWLMNRDGTNLRQLTNFDGNSVDAVWSPDGRQIAFASDKDQTSGEFAHYIINVDGTGLQRIKTNITNIGGRSDWSPDGRWLAFYAGPANDRNIFLAAIDGSGVYQLTDGGDNLAPSFSPDGHWIAFLSYKDGDGEIFIMRLDGSDMQQLTFNNRPDWQPRWGSSQ